MHWQCTRRVPPVLHRSRRPGQVIQLCRGSGETECGHGNNDDDDGDDGDDGNDDEMMIVMVM